MVDEKRLLKHLKQRRQNSIEKAIELYTPYLSTVVFNTAGSSLPREDIEEIISDVFFTLWEKADYIDLEKGTVRSYIAATARNLTLKRLKNRVEYVSIEDAEIPSDEHADESLRGEFLWSCVMELGEPDSELFVRYYKFGERLADIAKATGLNLSTVKSKLSRGKCKLKGRLQAANECGGTI